MNNFNMKKDDSKKVICIVGPTASRKNFTWSRTCKKNKWRNNLC